MNSEINENAPALNLRGGLTRMDLLSLFLRLDAGVLLMIGLMLIVAPRQIEQVFQFKDLPPAVSYLIGLWGCVFASMAIGYWVAATNPFRHVVWVQVGIARGALECFLGAVYLARGIVTWQQGGFGLIVAAFITLAYVVLYPGTRHVVRVAVAEGQSDESQSIDKTARY